MRLSAFISHKDSISGFVPSRARELKPLNTRSGAFSRTFVPSRARELYRSQQNYQTNSPTNHPSHSLSTLHLLSLFMLKI